MSDLAPFVAAALKDKCVTELMEENRRLRASIEAHGLVQVTGPGGLPIYAIGSMDEGECTGAGERWTVSMIQSSPCPLKQLCNVELRFGRMPLLGESELHDTPCMPLDFIIGCFDEERMGLFDIMIREGHSLSSFQARVGPFPSHGDYSSIDHLNRDENGEFLCSHLVELMGNVPETTISFHQLEFPLPRIQSVLDSQDVGWATLAEQREATRDALLRHLRNAQEGDDEELIALLTRRLEYYGGIPSSDEDTDSDSSMDED